MADAPLRLYGYSVSNYVNIVRAGLIEKALPYELVPLGAGQDERFLRMNPMGKIPALECDRGFLAETVAILDYLDDRYPAAALRPADPFARARMRQVINILQVYVEVPARRLYASVFASAAPDAADQAAVRGSLDRATGALHRLVDSQVFLLGAELTQADLFAYHTFELVERICRFVWDCSIVEDLGLTAWHERMAARPSSITIGRDFRAALRQYLSDHDAPYREAEAEPVPEHIPNA